MRRIIERVVTVVTTTTWKISWEAEPSPPSPADDLNSLSSDGSELLPGTPHPAEVEAKEVDESLTKDPAETKGG
jgi:hypothetical protein